MILWFRPMQIIGEQTAVFGWLQASWYAGVRSVHQYCHRTRNYTTRVSTDCCLAVWSCDIILDCPGVNGLCSFLSNRDWQVLESCISIARYTCTNYTLSNYHHMAGMEGSMISIAYNYLRLDNIGWERDDTNTNTAPTNKLSETGLVTLIYSQNTFSRHTDIKRSCKEFNKIRITTSLP